MHAVLRERFGHDRFRDGQEPVIRALLDGRSALAVFPTGGGKSLCYQLPALMLDGLTLVVSPLIALMKDQVDALLARGVAAARLDSTLDAAEVRDVFQRMEDGTLKLLYIAPERFANEGFRRRLRTANIALVAIDEAHCISAWGHNFRPDYLKIAKHCRVLKVPRVLALTATATPKVAAEIRKRFRIAVEDHVQLSFHRPNLDLRVTPCRADERKTLLLEKLRALAGSTIVYVTRQETAEEVATFLAKSGLAARAYHAGLPDEVRGEAQGQFMRGEIRIVVATIAFGMGIDKADIRAVFHYNLPKSLENYTQEIGRAGRDGEPAVCEMLACGGDLTVLENFIFGDTPTPRAVANLLDRVLRLGDTFDLSIYDLALSCDIRNTVVATVLTYLEIDGIIEGIGSIHSVYKVRLLRPMPTILAGRPPRERGDVQKLFAAGKQGRTWTEFRPQELAEPLGMKREKIVALLGELELAGELALAVSGVRQRYRTKKPAGDLRELSERLAAVFLRREKDDLSRLGQVLKLSACRGCLTARLTGYFGETLAEPCGHCDRCRGVPPVRISRPPARCPTDEEWQMVRAVADEGHSALGSPRQLARFLCGMSSPASTRARLGRHEAFGMFSDLPFADVLAIASAL